MSEAAQLYRDIALGEAWRLASLVDRNPVSSTRGSFSRTHWAWKFEDFPFPRLQEGVYALVKLHDLPGSDNPFYQSNDVANWIAWGFEYWTRLQHRNGAFDEAYPFEQCLAATAFTGFYLGSAYAEFRDRLAETVSARVLDALRRAAHWLCENDETHGVLSNHLAVAAASLHVAAKLCDEPRFGKRARFFLERILRHQSPEGWMKEYEGADIGYGTHCFFYLAAYWQMTRCQDTFAGLDRFAEFLSYFVHPDGTIGGDYASRNTEFYYPAGFEILAPHCRAAGRIALAMRASLRSRNACGVWAMDAFNFMPMLNNLFFARDAAQDVAADDAPWQRARFERFMPESGLWVVNREAYYAVIGLSKGGTVALFDKARKRLAARHSGLFATIGNEHFTSQNYSLSPPVSWQGPDTAVLQVPWRKFRSLTFRPWLFIAFRLFNLTLSRLPWVSRVLKEHLVRVLIMNKKAAPITHRRAMRVHDAGIEIEDQLSLPPVASSVTVSAQFAAIHMGSSFYADARATAGSTQQVDFQCHGSLALRGRLDLAGTQWRRLEP